MLHQLTNYFVVCNKNKREPRGFLIQSRWYLSMHKLLDMGRARWDWTLMKKSAEIPTCISFVGRLLQPGDIVRMMKCYANMWRGCLTLYSGKSGEISRVGDFCMVFNELINMSEPQLPSQNSNAPAVIPNSATNGNGRSLERNNSQQSQQAASAAAPPAASNNSTERAERGEKSSKVSGNSKSGYMRRPINKK